MIDAGKQPSAAVPLIGRVPFKGDRVQCVANAGVFTQAGVMDWIRMVLLTALAAVLPNAVLDVQARHPNIVLILADDMGYGDAGCYNPDSLIPTPNIDRLAREGMRFTDAHSPSSVCSPTRYGILTGRYAWRTVMKSRVLWAWDRPLIAADRNTLPKVLKRRGYHTACIGKWHLGWIWKTADGSPLKMPFEIGEPGPHAKRVELSRAIDYSQRLGGGPLAAGFDYYFGDDVINQPPFLWIENDRCLTLPTLPLHPKVLRGSSNGACTPGWDQRDVLPRMTRKALSFLDERANSGKPFFLYFPLTAPHVPIVPPAEFEGRSRFGPYGDFVAYVDDVTGQVMARLKSSGLDENSLVIFASDNGSYASPKDGHLPNGKRRGRKGMIYEGGHRIPLIVRWPGNVPAGSVNHNLVGLNDLAATVAAIISNPDPPTKFPDSINLLPTLRDPGVSVRSALVNHSVAGQFAIRDHGWKLILPLKAGDAGELYDLESDPLEKKNLWSSKPAMVERMKTTLASIRASGD